ncbi:hypothetical protein IW261DRAFT_1597126 [Armillaria novae-zelandiae]|uniref:Uncharacterized protein n=1 Tax=Armillaria novae-zelandiae TaxID=153914 RepID=A0AA39NU13_9AGAR|nr:hypothetical protein IW261DRAFT_1597126 [Armillaria novae-zelandiae]
MSAPFTLAEELAPVLQQIVGLDIFLRCSKEEHDAIIFDQEQLQREISAHRKVSAVILSHLSPEFIPRKVSTRLAKANWSSQVSEPSLLPRIHFTRKRKAHDSPVEVGQSSAGTLQLESNQSISSKRSRGIPADESGICQALKGV